MFEVFVYSTNPWEKKQCGSIKLIQEINLDIKYIKAKENVVANALCRLPKK